MTRCKVEIEPGVPVHKTVVKLNGVDVSGGISSLNLDIVAGDAYPIVNLNIKMVEFSKAINAEQAEVWLPDETVELLKALGWTPPDDEA